MYMYCLHSRMLDLYRYIQQAIRLKWLYMVAWSAGVYYILGLLCTELLFTNSYELLTVFRNMQTN